ncbi:MAG: hypothetical protein KZQ65_12315 [Candidatus Thiodiazotropha sp. (ex Gloverina cf. vestifex)]|nr:hypothetical protein [Candidatus Thiodiazotropha sp. (ex Gloverina cf. vestifex)]
MPLRQTGLFLFLLLCVSWAARSDTGCLKQAFGSYCLGGSIQQLQRQYPAGVPAQKQGDRSAVVYQNGRERTYVMAFKGQIYKVLHTYDPASQGTLKKLKERLEAKYGAYRDHSHYPAYARTKASRIGAVRRGEGELKHVWSSPEQVWRIELEWTRKLGVSLAYLANALDDEQREASDGNL